MRHVSLGRVFGFCRPKKVGLAVSVEKLHAICRLGPGWVVSLMTGTDEVFSPASSFSSLAVRNNCLYLPQPKEATEPQVEQVVYNCVNLARLLEPVCIGDDIAGTRA